MSNSYEDEARRRPKSRNLRPLLRLTPFLRPYRRQMLFALVALLAAAGATLAVPVAVRRIIDNGFTAENALLIDKYFLAMLAVVVVLAVGSALRFYFVMWIGERVVADIRDAIFSHLLSLSPGFFETQRSGEVLSRLTADTTQIKSAFSSTASIALRNVVMLIGTVAMMVASSPKLAGLSLLALPLIVLPLVTYGRRVRSLSRLAQDTLASSAAFAQERLLAVSTVQANVQENAARRLFNSATSEAFGAAAKRTFARAVLTALIIGVAAGAVVVLLWYGANTVISGSMSPGTLSQFLIYAILAASSASIKPFWEPSLASRRISSSSVVSSLSAVRAGIKVSSNRINGVPKRTIRAMAGALIKEIATAMRVPRALGRISPSRITTKVRAKEKIVRASPPIFWFLKTTAAKPPSMRLPKILKRLLAITTVASTLGSRPLSFCSSNAPGTPLATMS